MLTVLGVVLSMVFALLTLADIEWQGGRLLLEPRMGRDALVSALRGTSPWTASLFVLLTAATLPLRAWQWGVVLRPSGSFRDRYHAVAIGFMAVNLLPARLGEVTRGLVLAARVPGLSRAQSIGSVLFARILDLIALWLLSLPLPLLLSVSPSLRPLLMTGLSALTAVSLGMVMLVWAFGRQRERAGRWAGQLGGRGVARFVERFISGLGPDVGRSRLGRALAITVLFQLVSAFAYTPVLMDLAPEVPAWSGAIFGLVVASMGLALPSSPSGIGVYHFALAFALRAMGADPASAAAVAIVTHLGSVVAFVGGGVVSMLASAGMRRFRSRSPRASTR